MKENIIYCLMLAAAVFVGCNDDVQEKQETLDTVVEEETELKAGDVVITELSANEEVVVTLEDSIENFGTDDNPILIPIKKTYNVKIPRYQGVLSVMDRDQLVKFVETEWAPLFNLSPEKLDEKRRAFALFRNYMIEHDIDMAVFIEMAKNHPAKAKELVDRMSLDENGDYSKANLMLYSINKMNINPDQYLQVCDKANISPLKLYSTLAGAGMETRGVVGDIINIVRDGKDIVNMMVEFVNKKSVHSVESTVIHALHNEDKNENNYTSQQNHYFGEPLGLSYNKSKCQFRLECDYYATNKNYPAGVFVKNISMKVLENKCGPGKLILKTQYSGLTNIAGPKDSIIPKITASTSLQCGDCCLVQKFAYFNYEIYGNAKPYRIY